MSDTKILKYFAKELGETRYTPEKHAFLFAVTYLLIAAIACLALHIGKLTAEDEAAAIEAFQQLNLPFGRWGFDLSDWQLLAAIYFIIGGLCALLGVYGTCTAPDARSALLRLSLPLATITIIALLFAVPFGIGFHRIEIIAPLLVESGFLVFFLVRRRTWLRQITGDQPVSEPSGSAD